MFDGGGKEVVGAGVGLTAVAGVGVIEIFAHAIPVVTGKRRTARNAPPAGAETATRNDAFATVEDAASVVPAAVPAASYPIMNVPAVLLLTTDILKSATFLLNEIKIA